MACINSDGTLSPSAESVLKVAQKTVTDVEIAQATGLPLFRIRSSLRELVNAGLLKKDVDRYMVTESGASRVKG
jgi:predicted transcriptional regulator